MNFIFDNFYIIALIVVAFASWLKKRSEAKFEEEEQRRVREEMIRGLEEMSRQSPGPRPLAMPRPAPPLPKASHRAAPPPVQRPQIPQPVPTEFMPSEDFELAHQRQIEERLAEAKRAKQLTKDQAKERRNRSSREGEYGAKPAPTAAASTGLRATLKDRRSTRRAIVLREVLGPPLGMR